MNCGQVGEVRRETSPYCLTWRIANYFSLPAQVNAFHTSPHFYVMNLRCLLKIYPNGSTWNESKGWTNIYLCRRGTGAPKSVRYAFSIRENDGDQKDSFYRCETRMFSEEYPSLGITKFVRRSELLTRKSQGALSDALTVACTVWGDEPLFEEDRRLVSRESQTDDLADGCTTEEDLAHFDTKGGPILRKHFQDLLLNSKDHDITLKVKDQEFRAHKNILRARSPVFAAMFTHNMIEKECGEVCIEDCEPKAFCEFLKYVYVGKFENVPPATAVNLYYIADKYDFPDLKETCVEFLKASLTTNVICDVVPLAMNHGEDQLLECAMEFFSKHMIDTFMTVEWQRFIARSPTLANELNIKAMKISHESSE